jgi:hypothetical protein
MNSVFQLATRDRTLSGLTSSCPLESALVCPDNNQLSAGAWSQQQRLLYASQNVPNATTTEAAGDVLHLILALRADAAPDWF